MPSADSPIGVFDSGIGGLTVTRAVTTLLPNEKIIYFGDTAHLPYGDKSVAAIQAYSIKICNLLLSKGCKAILIACNSASTAAYELVKEYVGSKAIVINVVDPVVEYVTKHCENTTVGLIGTKQTVNSNVYKKKIEEREKGIELKSLATPLLVPMIEEGFFSNMISKNVVSEYLQNSELNGIKALILGCTHYPLIKNVVDEYYKGEVEVIDASEIVALFTKTILEENKLIAHTKNPEEHEFYVSDFTQSFQSSTRIFFGDKVSLNHYPLWD